MMLQFYYIFTYIAMLDGGQNFGSCQHDLYCDTDTAHYFLLILNNLLSELRNFGLSTELIM